MADKEVRITLRLPESLRDRLQQSADVESRSMNGEIVERLDWSFDRAQAEFARLRKLIADMNAWRDQFKNENRAVLLERDALARRLQETELALYDATSKLREAEKQEMYQRRYEELLAEIDALHEKRKAERLEYRSQIANLTGANRAFKEVIKAIFSTIKDASGISPEFMRELVASIQALEHSPSVDSEDDDA